MADTLPGRSRAILERSYDTTVESVWALWTTAEGIESWWGPEGFDVKVQALDLRPCGEMTYVMTATAPDQVDFMRKAGMPLATEAKLTFTEVDPPSVLAYNTLADFIPGVEPYLVATRVNLAAGDGAVRMTLEIEAMHDHAWTERALAGWESQLRKLARLVSPRPR